MTGLLPFNASAEEMKLYVADKAAADYEAGYSMASAYYEISQELGDVYSSMQSSLIQQDAIGKGYAYGYTDANGIQHESYSAACMYYGADTPEQIEAECAYYAQEGYIEHQDKMEAAGGPLYQFSGYGIDEIPF
jgi:hypothetical protein